MRKIEGSNSCFTLAFVGRSVNIDGDCRFSKKPKSPKTLRKSTFVQKCS